MDYAWMLDSPKNHTEADPTARLYALAELIERFAPRLPSLRPRFTPWVDVVYHIVPQSPHGVTGEFDWLRMPAELMRRYGGWDLDVSYESFWFDHPEWIRPKQTGVLSRLLAPLRKTGANKVASHRSPTPGLGSIAPVYRTLDSLPGPDFRV